MAKEKNEDVKEAKPAKSEVMQSASRSKADIIRASAMPEHKKLEALRAIGELKDEPFNPNKVPFEVYASLRGIKLELKKAMLVYPKAVGVKSATLLEWDEIFKSF